MRASRMSERRTTVLGALLTAIGPMSMAIYTPAMPQLVQVFATTEAFLGKFGLSDLDELFRKFSKNNG